MLENENGESYGVLIEPRSVNAIKESIEMLLANQDLKKACGKNAQKRVCKRYGIENVANQLIGIWSGHFDK